MKFILPYKSRRGREKFGEKKKKHAPIGERAFCSYALTASCLIFVRFFRSQYIIVGLYVRMIDNIEIFFKE